jgi:hypothetical protein
MELRSKRVIADRSAKKERCANQCVHVVELRAHRSLRACDGNGCAKNERHAQIESSEVRLYFSALEKSRLMLPKKHRTTSGAA